jgi:excisionase family DNA binding protein
MQLDAVSLVREALQDEGLRKEILALLQPDADKPQALLTSEQAGAYLGLSAKAVRQAVYRGTIPFVKLGRRLRFRPKDLEALL